jgi:hypothetical protein
MKNGLILMKDNYYYMIEKFFIYENTKKINCDENFFN